LNTKEAPYIILSVGIKYSIRDEFVTLLCFKLQYRKIKCIWSNGN